jgi:hypothetical protein
VIGWVEITKMAVISLGAGAKSSQSVLCPDISNMIRVWFIEESNCR